MPTFCVSFSSSFERDISLTVTLKNVCAHKARAQLVIYIAPGKNPGHKLQFSSPGRYCINTGPRVRVYSDSGYEDFLYAIDKTVQLSVHVEGMEE